MTLELTLDEFTTWYQGAIVNLLEPTRQRAVRELNSLLDSEFDASIRHRFRVEEGRVKGAARAYRKLSQPKYADRFTSTDRVPELIDDLIGMRLICDNLQDVTAFQVLAERLEQEPRAGLRVERGSVRDYFHNPKPSGYRALHVNLLVDLHEVFAQRELRVELQVRTLLQNGWGELTHEDTYKPGSAVPDWVTDMSSRMAELLAAVDNIAGDVRKGLDAASRESRTRAPESSAVLTTSERAAVERRARELLRGITASSLSETALQRDLTTEFGPEVATVWSRSGGLVPWVRSLDPAIRVSGESPSEFSLLGSASAPLATDSVPAPIRSLNQIEPRVPLISGERMRALLRALAEVAGSADYRQELAISGVVDEDWIAARMRSFGERQGTLVARPHAAYIAEIAEAYDTLRGDPSPAAIARGVLAEFELISQSNAMSAIDSPEVRGWLGID